MKKLIRICLSLIVGIILSSCTTSDEIAYEPPSYTIVYYDTYPYHYRYYNGMRYYFYRERPHRPRPNCSGVPSPPPRKHDFSKPSRPTNNSNRAQHSNNRNTHKRR